MSLERLDSLASGLKSLRAELNRTVGEVAQANGHILEDANTAQLAEGLDSMGRDIRPEYAPLTVEIKQAKGQPSDRVTLRDTGDFYAGIVAQVRGEEIELVGTDSKTDELLGRYGGAVLGLSEEAVDEFSQDYVRPELEAKTREILGL